MRCVRVVPAGHVGVVDVFGKVRSEALPSGLHVINPFASLHRMTVQTQEVKDTLDTPSSEGLTVHLDVSVQSHLDSSKAPDVYRTIGLEYESVLVKPNVRSAVREVTSSYEAKTRPRRHRTTRGAGGTRAFARRRFAGSFATGDSGEVKRRTGSLPHAVRALERKAGSGTEED